MKRTIRAMLPFLAVLGFAVWASPAYADQPDTVPQTAISATVSDSWDIESLSDAEFDALLVDSRVTATAKKRFDDEWVPVGAKLNFSSSRTLQQGEKFECEWAYVTDDYGADPVFTGRDCKVPLAATAADAGRYYYVYGVYSVGSELTGIVVTDFAARVAIEDSAVPALAAKPNFVVGTPTNINLKVARKTATKNYQYEEWETHVSDSLNYDFGGRESVSKSASNGSVTITPTLDWCSAYVKIQATLYSSTYAPVQTRLSLPDVVTGCPTQKVTRQTKIQITDEVIRLSESGSTHAEVEHQAISQTHQWYVSGTETKGFSDSYSSAWLRKDYKVSNKTVVLKETIRTRGFAPITITSNVIKVPKLSIQISYDYSQKGLPGRLPVVGEYFYAPKYADPIPGTTYSYKWKRDGVTIKDATSSKLKIRMNDLSRGITLLVTIKAPNMLTYVDTYEDMIVQPRSASINRYGGVKGSLKVGSKLSVKHWKTTPRNSTTEYRWYVDGKLVSTAGANTFVVGREHLGKTISVQARVTTELLQYKSTRQTWTLGTASESTSSVKAKLSAKSIRKSKSSKLTVTVKAPGTTKPVGTVKVTVGKKTFKASLKASHKGKVTIKLKGLKVGKNQAVKVKFTPSSKSTGKFSKVSKTTTVAKITVKK